MFLFILALLTLLLLSSQSSHLHCTLEERVQMRQVFMACAGAMTTVLVLSLVRVAATNRERFWCSLTTLHFARTAQTSLRLCNRK